MRIAYLANTVIPSHVASSIHIVKMCNAFVELGHEVTLFLMRRPDCESVRQDSDIQEFYGIENRFRIITMPRSKTLKSGFLQEHRFLKYYLRLFRVDLLYSRDHGWDYFNVPRLKKPFVLESHILNDSALLREMLTSPNFRFLTVISNQLKSDYESRDQAFRDNVCVFRDGADSAKPVKPIALSRSGRPVCGYIGNLFRGKGVELILRIARECPQYEFHIFGGTKACIEQWKSDPLHHGLTNVVFQGFIPHGNTDVVRASCDVLIAPYLREVAGYGANHINLAEWMSPLKIFEYMSSGRPIITSDLPVLREVLTHDKTALLCDPDDVQAWTRQLIRLQEDSSLAATIGVSAQKELESNYTWKSRAQQILDEVKRREPMLTRRAA